MREEPIYRDTAESDKSAEFTQKFIQAFLATAFSCPLNGRLLNYTTAPPILDFMIKYEGDRESIKKAMLDFVNECDFDTNDNFVNWEEVARMVQEVYNKRGVHDENGKPKIIEVESVKANILSFFCASITSITGAWRYFDDQFYGMVTRLDQADETGNREELINYFLETNLSYFKTEALTRLSEAFKGVVKEIYEDEEFKRVCKKFKNSEDFSRAAIKGYSDRVKKIVQDIYNAHGEHFRNAAYGKP